MKKNIWEWINNLAKGLQKVADESQLNYRQVHAYIDGHDKLLLSEMDNKLADFHPTNYASSPDGSLYEITVNNSGKVIAKKVGEN